MDYSPNYSADVCRSRSRLERRRLLIKCNTGLYSSYYSDIVSTSSSVVKHWLWESKVDGSDAEWVHSFCQLFYIMKPKAILPAQWLSIGFGPQRSVVRLPNVPKKGLRFLEYQILKISFKNKSKTKKAHIFDPQSGLKMVGRACLYGLLSKLFGGCLSVCQLRSRLERRRFFHLVQYGITFVLLLENRKYIQLGG